MEINVGTRISKRMIDGVALITVICIAAWLVNNI